MQMVSEPALECYLNLLLHVLETTVYYCCRNGNASKSSQEPGKMGEILPTNISDA